MGAFLGRRGQSKSLNTVQSIHTKMLQWRHELPKELQLASYAAQDEQSSLLQLQALNLQLTYDNLQIILHRTAAFENDGQMNELRMTGGGSTSLQQLLDSAMDTSELYRYSSALQASGRTHAAMHIGITLFTAGVVLCAICLSRPLTDMGNRAKTGVMHIIRMCRSAADSPTSSQHLISRQSLDILDSLVTVVLRQETELITARIEAEVRYILFKKSSSLYAAYSRISEPSSLACPPPATAQFFDGGASSQWFSRAGHHV
ncbi:NAD-dependent deacetylase hst4 [Verticillium dahliae VDG1]|nr:NAD-dependent deacetylase hst4 [Verticillium dahliae VDG1]